MIEHFRNGLLAESTTSDGIDKEALGESLAMGLRAAVLLRLLTPAALGIGAAKVYNSLSSPTEKDIDRLHQKSYARELDEAIAEEEFGQKRRDEKNEDDKQERPIRY